MPLTDSESERARARPQARKAEPGRQEACLVSSRLVSSVQCRMPLAQPLTQGTEPPIPIPIPIPDLSGDGDGGPIPDLPGIGGPSPSPSGAIPELPELELKSGIKLSTIE